jgi:hypothetical protein
MHVFSQKECNSSLSIDFIGVIICFCPIIAYRENIYKKSRGTYIFLLCVLTFFEIWDLHFFIFYLFFGGGGRESTTAAADGREVLRFGSSILVLVFQRCLAEFISTAYQPWNSVFLSQ